MSKSEHTKGPLSIGGTTGDGSIALKRREAGGDAFVAFVLSRRDASETANAARLVACWNACEGISTEALDAGIGSTCAHRDALADVRRLRAQRDALLAALADVELRCTQAKIASTIGKGKDRTDFLRGELERIAVQARAAISAAEGRP